MVRYAFPNEGWKERAFNAYFLAVDFLPLFLNFKAILYKILAFLYLSVSNSIDSS